METKKENKIMASANAEISISKKTIINLCVAFSIPIVIWAISKIIIQKVK